MERFTISLDDRLAADFDGWIAGRGYASRSEAVRDLLRSELERSQTERGEPAHCVACLSYVYDHRERQLAQRLAALQHAQHDIVVSSLHVHLDHEHGLETVILRGDSAAVRRLADSLCAERGVHHGHLNLISVELHGAHRHEAAAGPQPAGAGDDAAAAPGRQAHLHARPSH